jgi:hypothetical protein
MYIHIPPPLPPVKPQRKGYLITRSSRPKPSSLPISNSGLNFALRFSPRESHVREKKPQTHYQKEKREEKK